MATSIKPLNTFASGELVGVVAATQNPNIPCVMVKIKAHSDNPGNVYIGAAGVTKKDGATDTTTGFMLDAGDDTGWLLISNLNLTYRICDSTSDCVTYMYLR